MIANDDCVRLCTKRYYGIYVPSWPAVFGNDGAGVVEDVGKDVKGVKKGDEVLAIFSAGDERKAAFQVKLPSSFASLGVCTQLLIPVKDYAAVHEHAVGLKPKSLSAEDAASLPSVPAGMYAW